VIYALTAVFTSIGVLVITTDGTLSLFLLAGGLALLFSTFACLRGGRFNRLWKGLRHNWATARQVRAERHSLEYAQLQMHASDSFGAWWETVCNMARQMQFRSIRLWKRQNGDYVTTCSWNTDPGAFTAGKTVRIDLPFGSNGVPEWELRAYIGADGDLELCGRQAMLLARLMDEFAPPEQEDEVQTPDHPADVNANVRMGVRRQFRHCLGSSAKGSEGLPRDRHRVSVRSYEGTAPETANR